MKSERVGANPLRSLMLLVMPLMLLPFATLAQSPEGDLAGSVQDYSGARVPLARIVVQSDTAVEREATTDSRGEFRLNLLPPGTYHVSVNADGFAEAQSDVTVVVSSVREIQVTLQVAAAHQNS